jgi:hypothetical protein
MTRWQSEFAALLELLSVCRWCIFKRKSIDCRVVKKDRDVAKKI